MCSATSNKHCAGPLRKRFSMAQNGRGTAGEVDDGGLESKEPQVYVCTFQDANAVMNSLRKEFRLCSLQVQSGIMC